MQADALSATLAMYPELFTEAQTRGELPAHIDPIDPAGMITALVINAVDGCVRGAHDQLAPVLAYRARVLLSGVRAEDGE